MRINARRLSKLPVVTEGGIRLGHVVDFEFDADAHAIVTYLVRQGMLGGVLRIAPSQVVSITADRVVVKDTVVPVGADALAKAASVKIEPVATASYDATRG